MISFIEGTLKLRVNRDKSGVFRPSRAKFLGYTFVGTTGAARVHNKSFQRLRDKLKEIFFRAELRSSLRNFESQNDYGYKPCIKRRFQNAETLQSRNQKNSS